MENAKSDRKPGGTIDSWCGKCKLVLAHTIEAMTGDKPARVNCNTCRSQHSYKPRAPGTVRQPRKKEGESATTTSRSGRTATSRYQSALKAGNTVPKTYSPQGKYETGDVLDHPTFGRGVTTAVKDGTKIEVLFETGSKTLIHAR